MSFQSVYCHLLFMTINESIKIKPEQVHDLFIVLWFID